MKARPPEREHARALDAALRTSATSVVPPPTSMNSAPGLADLVAVQAPRHCVRLGDDGHQLQVEHAGDGLQRPQVDQRRERVEDADAHVAALEADRVGDRVAVDGGAGHGGVDEPDVDVRQAGLPGDGPLGLVHRLALDAVDELLQLRVADGAGRGACAPG